MAHVSAPIPPASASNPSLAARARRRARPRRSRRSPSTGIGSAAEFVDALRDALDQAAGTTQVAAVPAGGAAAARRRVRLLLLLLARRALLAGIARGGAASPATTAARRPHRRAPPSTVQKTVTLAGHDGRPDGHDRARAASGDNGDAADCRPRQSPSALNDQGFELMKAGRYEEALPLLEQAVAGLAGRATSPRRTRATTSPSRCARSGSATGVVELLDRSRGGAGQAEGDQQAAEGHREGAATEEG